MVREGRTLATMSGFAFDRRVLTIFGTISVSVQLSG